VPQEPRLLTEFARALLKTGALRFGAFTLASGRLSSYYIDLRQIPSLPSAYHLTTRILQSILEEEIGIENCDVIAGIPTSGLTFAAALAFKTMKPLIYVRREAKPYGTQRWVEGILTPGSSVTIVDDVITDGRSKLEAVRAIRSEGGEARHVLVLIDRLEGGREALAGQGVQLHSFTTILELAEHLKSLQLLEEEQYRAILAQVEGQG